MSTWLIDNAAAAKLQSLYENHTPSAADLLAFELQADIGENRSLSYSDTAATITIRGAMTKNPDWYARIFGGGNTTYTEIVSAIQAADSDPRIETITLDIDSPGGNFDGIIDVVGALENVKKPVTAYVSGVCASAAYAIASQANEIIACNEGAQIGSLGVAVSIWTSKNDVVLTSTDAPKKRPDVNTETGKKYIIETLDAMHDLFIDGVAKGRGVSVSKVNANFGQGATLLAGEALKRGMIDSIETKSSYTEKKPASSGQEETKHMNIAELKNQHPALYAEAVAVGKEQGKNAELERVNAHLLLGKTSGDMSIALEAIEKGAEFSSPAYQSRYMAASMSSRDVENRTADDAAAAAATDGVDTSAPANASGKQAAKQVLSIVQSAMGVE